MTRSLERALRKQEVEDFERLRSAFYKMETDPNLRFFLRWMLEQCGYGSAPASSDPLTLSRACGILSVASSLTATMEQFTPNLLAALIQESINERSERNTDTGSD